MVGGINGNYNAGYLSGTSSYLSKQASSVSNYDYKAAQRETQALIDQYKNNQTSVKQLKADTAAFLDDYRNSFTKLDKAAQSLQGGNFDAMLYGKTGRPAPGADGKTPAPTQENVDKTAAAVEKLVEQFNSSLKLMNDNAKRGPGVEKQIGRMVQSPAAERSMALVGISVNKDGTLKVDSDKLKTALKDNTEIARDVIGGSTGIARGIQRDSTSGMNQTPSTLIARDLANMKQQQTTESSFTQMAMYSKSGAYNMMNMNSVGVLMNMLV